MQAFIEGLLYAQNQARAWVDSRLRQGCISLLKQPQGSEMCLAFAESSTAFPCFYSGVSLKQEEPGEETEEGGLPCFSEGTASQLLLVRTLGWSYLHILGAETGIWNMGPREESRT